MSAEAAPRTAARRRKTRWAIAALVIAVLAVAATVIATTLSSGGEVASDYETHVVSVEGIEVVASGDGQAVVATSTAVFPEVGGTVTDVYVEVGDTVSEGDVLFLIDETDLQNATDQAYASLMQAKQSGAQADQSLKQAEQSVLQADQSLSQAEQTLLQAEQSLRDLESKPATTSGLADQIELAEKQVETAEAGVDAAVAGITSAHSSLDSAEAGARSTSVNTSNAQASYDQAIADLNLTRVCATADGVVTSLNVEEGGSASGSAGTATAGATGGSDASSSAAVVISDLVSLKVRIQINEIDLADLEIGQAAVVTFDAIPGAVASGTVAWISPNSETSGGVVSYAADVTLNEPLDDLAQGMTATVDIVTRVSENVLVVPNAAVKVDSTQKFVEILDGSGEVIRVDVTVGVSDDMYTEITEGLQEGQEVVVGTAGESESDDRVLPFGGGN